METRARVSPSGRRGRSISFPNDHHMAGEEDEKSDVGADRSGDDPDLWDQDRVQHSIHGNSGEGQWDPAPGFTEVIDTQSEQWTDPDHHEERPEGSENVDRRPVIRAQGDVHY